MKRFLMTGLIGGVLVLGGAGTAVVWTTCRIYVPEDHCAILIKKTGQALPPGQLVATSSDQKGVQETVLGPGRHFYDPIRWDWEIKPQTVISAGDPTTWEWIHSLNEAQRNQLRAGTFRLKGDFPKIGVITRKVGTIAPTADRTVDGQIIVDRASGHRGIVREVLTPGIYKVNPEVYDVEIHDATVIPAGFVGVVTNLVGDDRAEVGTGDDTQLVRALAAEGERGTLRNVLQPGIYFLNPKMQKVTLIEIGFNEFSQLSARSMNADPITFPSDTGYMIQVGVTVVWGIDPTHAAEVINEFGNVDRVLDKIIRPQLRSIARNIGSTYDARDFIQGEKRELFQRDLTEELQRICGIKNVEILLALVREIEVLSPDNSSESVTEDLRRTIQESFVAIENRLTKKKQTEAATVRAQLEEVRKEIDIARETIQADTRKMVAQLQADGEKEAAEIDAQAALDIAVIQQEVAELDAQRVEILGKARTDVEKMKKSAEAEGYRMLVDAFGSPDAFNLYTFADRFEPQSIRLFYAGDGTFWTDLKRFEEVGAARVMQTTTGHAAPTPPSH
jgi:regulator of protease activity HflC (stomatin/prohibitin superfamily)